MLLFCFINFDVDHGFLKKISFGTLCLTSLKKINKEGIQLEKFSHSMIHKKGVCTDY